MRVLCEIDDYSNPKQPKIKIHSKSFDGTMIDLEINNIKYTVCADELISAINKAKLNVLGR